jgi:hypothetical protein
MDTAPENVAGNYQAGSFERGRDVENQAAG